jgi:hypothetical protein
MDFLELEKIYRQHDPEFIDLLNAVRNNSVTEEQLELLNQRYQPDFEPSPDDFYVHLTTINELAEKINQRQLEKLWGELYVFTGRIKGRFGEEYLPTAVELSVKAGAQIMMVNNDPEGRWVNGSLGRVTDLVQPRRGEPIVLAELADGGEVEITPHTWEIFRFYAEVYVALSRCTSLGGHYPQEAHSQETHLDGLQGDGLPDQILI